MKVTYNGGAFYCDADEHKEIMKLHKWFWDGEYWFTYNPQNALPLEVFCSPAAKKKLDSYRNDFLNKIGDSFAVDSDRDIPAPEGLNYIGYQRGGIDYADRHNNNILIADPCGLGKTIQAIGYSNLKAHAQPYESKVLTPHGWRTMGSLQVGDMLCHPVKGVQWVSAIYEQGPQVEYVVVFEDNSKVSCSLDHLWSVEVDGKHHETYSTANLINMLQDQRMLTVPCIYRPTLYSPDEINIDPYILGVIIAGRARIVGNNVLFRTDNDEQMEAIMASAMMLPGEHMIVNEHEYCLEINGPSGQLADTVASWTLVIASNSMSEKHMGYFETLPPHYRELILQGFNDHCGTPETGWSIATDFPSEFARTFITTLVKSLGGKVMGDKIYLSSSSECFLTTKQDEFDDLNDPTFAYIPDRRIVAIVRTSRDVPMRCIRVSHPDHLYVTDNYVVTHNCDYKVLIVCPATLKENWQREWTKWDVHNLSTGIVQTKVRTKTVKGETTRWTEMLYPDTNVVIINYEQLEKFDEYVKKRKWDLVIVDEAGRLGNPQTKTNKVFFGGRHVKKKDGKNVRTTFKPIKATKIIYLDGTPLTKSPIGMFSIIQSCDPTGLGANWKKFVHRYCDATKTPFGMDTSGASNLEELQYKMRERFMVRRDKREVLTQLPEKRRELVFLPSEGLTRQIENELSTARKAMFEFEKMMGLAPVENPSLIPVENLPAFMAEYEKRFEHASMEERVNMLKDKPLEIAFEEFAEARKELALAKIPMLKDRIKRALEEEQKILFFGIHTDFIEALADEVGEDFAMITGKVPPHKRQAQVDLFQNDEDCRMFYGNIRAAGVGITLTAAAWTMFGEWGWNPSDNEQAEDRTWRIGQRNACLSQYMVVADSLDARVVELNDVKSDRATKALDHKNIDPSRILSRSIQF